METGTLTLNNGSPIFSGQFSGFDSVAIVDATIQAKRIPAIRMESTIEQNDLLKQAYGELNTLLTTLQSAANALRNPPGLSGTASNIFENKAAFLTSQTSTAATELLGVSATNSAATGTYEVEILQIAKAHKQSSGTVADATAAQGITDTITLGLTGGTTKDISITSDMTLNDIAGAINAVTDDTDVRASVIKVSDSDYRLVITAEETGKDITLTGSSGEFLTAYGDGTSLTDLQTADKAQIKVDGIATVIERDSNDIDDVIDGVTLQLYKAEAGNSITVEIQNDLGAAKSKITEFVDAYNAVRDLVLQQREFDPTSEDGGKPILYADDILRSVDRSLSGTISSGALGLDSGLLDSLTLIGIELDDSNKLVINDTDLDEALVGDLDSVRNIFEFGFSADDSRLGMLARTDKVNVDDFELVIDGVDASGNITGASVTGYGSVFDVSGTVLTGKEGTDFEGMKLVFVGDPGSGAQTIQVKTSLGIAESIYQDLEDFVKPGSGTISTRLLDIEDENTDLADRIASIDDRLAIQRQFLLEKYAKMETALAQADAMRKQLEAMADSGSN